MGWFRDYNEPDDPLDNPKYESEYYKELEDYWQKLDDKERWSE